MLCPKCGREIPYGTSCPCSGGGTAPSGSPAQNLIKKLGSSPLLLTAVILFTISLALNLCAGIMSFALPDFAMSAPVSGASSPTLTVSFQGNMALSILMFAALIPDLLICIGIWMFSAACRKKETEKISTAGLTLCKGVYIAILSLIGVLVAVLVVSLLTLLITAIFSSSGDSMYPGGVPVVPLIGAFSVFYFIFLGAILALPVAFVVSKIKTVNRIKSCLATGMPDHRVSNFLIAMLWIRGVILGFFGLIMLLFSFLMVNLPGGPPISYTVVIVLRALGWLAASVCVIFIAVLLGRLRREMSILVFSAMYPMQSLYQGASGQPAPQFYPTVPIQSAPPTQFVPPVQPSPSVPSAQETAAEPPAEVSPDDKLEE